MTITIKESKILEFQMKGFIFCGDMIISPEDATKQDKEYLENRGYKLME